MEKRKRIIIAVLLILAIANYTRLGHAGSISTVDFLSILVMGGLAGILMKDVMSMMRRK